MIRDSAFLLHDHCKRAFIPCNHPRKQELPRLDLDQSRPAQGFDMHKNIRRVLVAHQEPIAFQSIEPLDRNRLERARFIKSVLAILRDRSSRLRSSG